MSDLSHLAQPGTTLVLRVTPNASAAAIRAEGETIHVRITVPPEKGKANAAVLKAMSKALGVPKSRLQIASGATGRNKTLRIL